MATEYELAKVVGDIYKHIGDYPTLTEAYQTARAQGPGTYAVGEVDAGHHDVEVVIDEDGTARGRVGDGPWWLIAD